MTDFPVLTSGPTQYIEPNSWNFTLKVGSKPIKSWSWNEFNALPQTQLTCDIHCVTRWTKLDTHWGGVLVDDLLSDAALAPPTEFTLATSVDGYSTNVPLPDLAGGKGMVALNYEGVAITPDHGGPARLLVPHLYFWKSAKYVSCLQFTDRNVAGFWETRGYHIHGDPWREQRYTSDE
ncbi:MAG TPA: molybdopterin-dependent oxidoreductase [Candidatus Acidoferrales bacterium]|nr:molybdopterin-dependent oxidoreductase [Candidatus Acidoferrales bacterium]